MEKTERKHKEKTQTANTEKTQKENTDRKHREKTPPQPQKHLQYYSVPQSTGKWRKGRSATLKVCILPQFWTSNTHEVTRGLPWSAEEFAFLPQFWASDTSEVTKGLLGPIQNLHFTSVLGVRHIRSDERVARRAQKFAFYHSFERPTRPKWRKGRAAKWKICVLPQFWASDTSEVTKGSIGDVKNLRFTTVLSVRHARSHERVVKSTGAIPAPQTEKEYILTLFQTILISSISLQSFL